MAILQQDSPIVFRKYLSTLAIVPGTTADDNAVGTVAWSNTGNVTASDDTYATAALSNTNTTSHYLKLTNFGFTIPATATITGVLLQIERSVDATTISIQDNIVKLVKGGTVVGSNKSTAEDWTTTDIDVAYGGQDDLWGTTLTYADVNASNFGVVISAKRTAGTGTSTAQIDYAVLTVYYVTTGTDWATGFDSSDSYEFKISNSTDISTHEVVTIDQTGSMLLNTTGITITDLLPSSFLVGSLAYTDSKKSPPWNFGEIYTTDGMYGIFQTTAQYSPTVSQAGRNMFAHEFSSQYVTAQPMNSFICVDYLNFINGGCTVQKVIGQQQRIQVLGGSTVVDARSLNVFGIYKSGVGSTITNAYGLYIEDQTVGTNNWAIKTGQGLVFFGDKVEVFNANNKIDLDSNGSGRLTLFGQLQLSEFTAGGGAISMGAIDGRTTQGNLNFLAINPNTQQSTIGTFGRGIAFDIRGVAGFGLSPITIQDTSFFGNTFPSDYVLAAPNTDISFFYFAATGGINITDDTKTVQLALFVTANTVTTSTGKKLNSLNTFANNLVLNGDNSSMQARDWLTLYDFTTLQSNGGSGAALIDLYTTAYQKVVFGSGTKRINTHKGFYLKAPEGVGTIRNFVGYEVDDFAPTSQAWSWFSHGDNTWFANRGQAIFGLSPVASTTLGSSIADGATTVTLTSSTGFASAGVIRILDRYYTYTANNTGTGVLTLQDAFIFQAGATVPPGTSVYQYTTPISQVDVYVGDPNRNGVNIYGYSGQANDLLDMLDSSGTLLTGFDFNGKLIKYNGITTVSNGVPAEYAKVDLTAQTAAITATTLYTPTATGMYRISIYIQITTAASVSSVLGGATGFVLTYNDGDGNVAQSDTVPLLAPNGTVVSTLNSNTTATNLSGSVVINAKTGVAIQYAIGYTSVGTAMQYAVHLKLEAL
jgi:hypothetical protein